MSLFTKSESSSSICTNNESKHYNMKQFINAVRDYSITRAEETANLINRHLQLLSVSIDLSIFDPHTSIVSEFFVSLHELLSNLEPRSTLAWCCVNVLTTCCKNSATRNSLIHIYEFVPQLSRLLGDHLVLEKKIRLLTLLQELTCGVKISWQVPNLHHLMSTLTKWINNDINRNDEIVSLSLGVLVNMCYKNLPAVYTLTKCIDIKKFLRTTTIKNVEDEVNLCKLLIILDHMNGKVPFEALINLTKVTFKSINQAFRASNSILLRHTIEFFLDIRVQDGRQNFIAQYETCDTEVCKLLDTIENNPMSSGDGNNPDPECVSLLLLFLQSLVELKLPKLMQFYQRLVRISLRWMQTENVSTQALIMLQTIAMQEVDSSILESIINDSNSISILLIELEHKTEDLPTNLEYNKKLSALMQLLLSLLKVESLREKIINLLKEEHLHKIFVPLLGNNSPRSKANDVDVASTEAIKLYIISLALIYEMGTCNEMWNGIYRTIMEQKQMHIVLAQGLYGGSADIRCLVLNLTSSKDFPKKSVSEAMMEIQPMVQIETTKVQTTTQLDSFYSPMSVAQSEKLDEVLNKLRNAVTENDLLNSATSDVMELYEYKLASMGHAERAAIASVEAASQKCTHLQHRIAQLTAELSRTHQILFHSQQRQGDITKDRDSLLERSKELNNRLDAEKGRNKAVSSQLAIKEKRLTEKEADLEETTKRLKETESIKYSLEEQNNFLKSVMAKLEENLKKKEKTLEKKEELLNRANSNIDHMKGQIGNFENQLSQTQADLSSTSRELSEVKRELANKKQIIDTITKLANANH